MFSCKSDSTLSPFPLVDAPKPASYLEPVCSKCSCWHEHEVRHAAADNTSATPECSDVGTAPTGAVQSAASTEANYPAAKSHAHEAPKLWEQHPSFIRTPSSNGEPPSSSGCSTAVPLPTKLWYKSRNPTCFYQSFLSTGSKS